MAFFALLSERGTLKILSLCKLRNFNDPGTGTGEFIPERMKMNSLHHIVSVLLVQAIGE